MKLYEYQEQAVNYAHNNPYCILGLDVGLGKTIVALTAGHRSSYKMLVLCPAYLKLNWINEIKKVFNNKITKKVQLFDSKKQLRTPDDDTNIVIVSYSLVEQCEALFEWADMLICDEAHYLKSMKAKRTEHVHRLIYENSLKSVLLLTGTPIQNRVWEFYSLMAICNYNPRIKEPLFLTQYESYVDFANKFSYREEYTVEIKNKMVTIVNWRGFRKENISELKKHLKGIYLRIKAEEVLKDLPEKIYKDVLISNVQNRELLKAFNEAQARGMDVIRPEIKALAALQKTPFTVNYVQDLLETGVKVIVYSDHVESIKAIAEALKVEAITGSMPTKRRHELADAFQNGDAQLLCVTIGSFSTGVTLTACHNTVYNDRPWTPGALDQADGRTRRIGQLNACVYHSIFGSYTDQFIAEKLAEKSNTIKNVT